MRAIRRIFQPGNDSHPGDSEMCFPNGFFKKNDIVYIVNALQSFTLGLSPVHREPRFTV